MNAQSILNAASADISFEEVLNMTFRLAEFRQSGEAYCLATNLLRDIRRLNQKNLSIYLKERRKRNICPYLSNLKSQCKAQLEEKIEGYKKILILVGDEDFLPPLNILDFNKLKKDDTVSELCIMYHPTYGYCSPLASFIGKKVSEFNNGEKFYIPFK